MRRQIFYQKLCTVLFENLLKILETILEIAQASVLLECRLCTAIVFLCLHLQVEPVFTVHVSSVTALLAARSSRKAESNQDTPRRFSENQYKKRKQQYWHMGALFSKKFLRGQKQSEYIEYERNASRKCHVILCSRQLAGELRYGPQNRGLWNWWCWQPAIAKLNLHVAGKSAFSIQFVSNHFVETYDRKATTFRQANRTQLPQKIAIANKYRWMTKYPCWRYQTRQGRCDDRKGFMQSIRQEEFSAMRDQWFRTGDGFILMYRYAALSAPILLFYQCYQSRQLQRSGVRQRST